MADDVPVAVQGLFHIVDVFELLTSDDTSATEEHPKLNIPRNSDQTELGGNFENLYFTIR